MRVLVISQAFPPFIGGSEQYAHDLSIELTERGNEVTVVTLFNKEAPSYEIENGVKIHRLKGSIHRAAAQLFRDPSRGHSPPFPDPEITYALAKVITSEQPQIVHAIDWMVHSFLPLKKWSKAKLVMTLQDYSFKCVKKTLSYKHSICGGPRVFKCINCSSDHYGLLKGSATYFGNYFMGFLEQSLVDMFVPVSQAVAANNFLIDSGLPYKIIPNFVMDPLENVLEDSNSILLKDLPPDSYLLFVGALSKKKGLDVLLDAYAGLKNAPPLVVIGYETTEYPVNLNDLSKNVTVLKNWPHNAVLEAWQRCMMGIIPSTWPEPFGIVVLEAMLAGKPVIASNHGVIVDIVTDGETGILIPPKDTSALQNAIDKLIRDPDLRSRMGEKGKRKVTFFLAKNIVEKIENLYKELLGNL